MTSAKLREEFLEAADGEDNEAFLDIMQRHVNKRETCDIGELVPTLERKQLNDLWSHLHMKVTTALLNLETSNDELEDLLLLGNFMEMVIIVAMETLKIEDLVIPPALFETAVLLHGCLLALPSDLNKLANAISQLCESWWTAQLEGREQLVPQTIVFLLETSLQPKATKAVVRRIWRMHDALEHVDFTHPSSNSLRELLQNAAISPMFVKSQEGQKFIGHILQLNEILIDDIHRTIKNTLLMVNRSTLDAYGMIYFKAWRFSTGAILEKLEKNCIQDFIFLAINVESKIVSSNLRRLLGHFHKQKRMSGVDEMLNRLYEPIIWRNLKVANDEARASALALLIDAFPLQNPSDGMEAIDELRQKQFDILDTMLMDPSVHVRGLAAQGICRICSVYWELLPPNVIKSFILKLSNDLAWDSSSADVRYAVIKGLSHLLDNHLSHPLLRSVLPELRNLLHDQAEKVRVAFLDLLLKVKTIKSIRFYHITPVEHLLARLEIDSSCVTRRIVSILVNSYVPEDKSNEEMFSRCVSLIKDNANAARRFFHIAAKNNLTVVNTSKLMVLICRAVLKLVREETTRAHAPGQPASRRSDSAFVSADILESDDEDEDQLAAPDDSGVDGDKQRPSGESPVAAAPQDDLEDDDEEALSVRDTHLMLALLDIVVILWSVLESALKQERYADIKKRLEQRFTVALPEYLRVFHNPTIVSTLILLAGFLPPNAVPMLSRSMLSKLRGMTSQSAECEYSAMLRSMCQWGKADHVLELLEEWLKAALVTDSAPNESANSSKRASTGRRRVAFQENVSPQPLLALRMLCYMLREHKLRPAVIAAKHMANISNTLSHVMKCIEKRLASDAELNEHMTDEFIIQAFETYIKIEALHNATPDEVSPASMTSLDHLITWCDAEVLHLFRTQNPAAKGKRKARRLLAANDATLLADTTMAMATQCMQSTLGGATLSQTLLSETMINKRSISDAHAAASKQLALSVLESMVTLGAEVMLVGMANQDLARRFADLAMKILQLDECTRLLVPVTQLMYQTTQFLLYLSDDAKGEGNNLTADGVTRLMLTRLLQMLLSMATSNREQADRVFPGLKVPLSEMLFSYQKQQLVHKSDDQEVINAIVTGTFDELKNIIKKDSCLEPCDSVSNLPPFSSLLLSIMQRKAELLRSYLYNVQCKMTTSESVDTYDVATCLYLLHPVAADRKCASDLKECLQAIQALNERAQLPENESTESPTTHLLEQNKTTLKDCMIRTGMVV